jgi:serine/threonine protein kinase
MVNLAVLNLTINTSRTQPSLLSLFRERFERDHPKYKHIKKLNTKKYCEVHEYKDTTRCVAVKFLECDCPRNIQRELQLAKEFGKQKIGPTVYDMYTKNRFGYIVMQKFDTTLYHLLKENQTVFEKYKADIAKRLVSLIEAVSSQHYVLHDLKLDNIVVSIQGSHTIRPLASVPMALIDFDPAFTKRYGTSKENVLPGPENSNHPTSVLQSMTSSESVTSSHAVFTDPIWRTIAMIMEILFQDTLHLSESSQDLLIPMFRPYIADLLRQTKSRDTHEKFIHSILHDENSQFTHYGYQERRGLWDSVFANKRPRRTEPGTDSDTNSGTNSGTESGTGEPTGNEYPKSNEQWDDDDKPLWDACLQAQCSALFSKMDTGRICM